MKYQLLYGLAVVAATLAPSEPGDPPAIDVSAAADRIDRFVEADLRRAGLQPNDTADDATFLRRAYLGIVGRIPTVPEAEQFLASTARDRRAKLIDQLLDSPGYVSHRFNFWADLLRVKARIANQVSGEPFSHFIKQSLTDNTPYDQFVAEMLTADGAAHDRGNGATGLFLRDRGMPLDSMSNTVRVFLGTRLECAQCHDHPNDKWTQMDFYQMAAFTGGVLYNSRANRMPGIVEGLQELRVEMRREQDTIGQRALNQLLRPVSTAITGSGAGLIRMPRDYQYDDARPNSLVTAKALFGEQPEIDYSSVQQQNRRGRRRAGNRQARQRGRGRASQLVELDSRTALAEWMTSPDNPRFTTVIANRMWKLVMGRGLIEPIDNMMDDTEASNPALMRHLEDLMVDVGYDLKEFTRILYNTDTFQREATRAEVPDDEKYHFQGPLLRRMTAEQVWDSMLTLVLREPDGGLTAPDAKAEQVYQTFEAIAGMTAEELREQVDVQRLRYTDPQKFRQLQREARQAERQKQREEQQRTQAELRAKVQPLARQLNRARRDGDQELVAVLESKLRALGVEPRRRGRGDQQRRPRSHGPLVRASDLPSPAPDGHFVRQFGQSDREQIQASHTEANVPQVLSMLNGFIEDAVLGNPVAALSLAVAGAGSDDEKVRVAYLAILGREPGGREQAMWALDLERQGDETIDDLIWTLVNTHEFRFVQ